MIQSLIVLVNIFTLLYSSSFTILMELKYIKSFSGASDDGAGCAVLLEILRTIAISDKVLKHNLIFLFNGAEENIMQASHGFITQHRWAKEVRAFINLEGINGMLINIIFS